MSLTDLVYAKTGIMLGPDKTGADPQYRTKP